MDSRELITRKSKVKRTFLYLKKFGFVKGMNLILSLKSGSEQTTFRYGRDRLLIRNKTSDVPTFEQIFLDEDYKIDFGKLNPRLIIDAGANVGYASIYLANKFPTATILAVEPEKNNFELLKKNIQGFPTIKAIQSAIWNEDTYLHVIDNGQGAWGFTVESTKPDTPGAFKATTIGTLLHDSGFAEIDILKMDIEGAEKEVFSSNYQPWLGHVKAMIVELHDRLKEGTSDVFYNAIKGYKFSIQEKGENLILFRDNQT